MRLIQNFGQAIFPGLALVFGTFLFIAQQLPSLSLFHWFPSNAVFYIGLPLTTLVSLFMLWKTNRQINLQLLRHFLFLLLPSLFLLFIGVVSSPDFHFVIPLSIGLYLILCFFYIATRYFQKNTEVAAASDQASLSLLTPLNWRDSANRQPLFIMILLTILFLSFGMHHLAKFAAVDEPLWLDGRIGKFWKNLSENRLDKTLVSDKPGITLVWATSPALLSVTPKDYRETRFEFQTKKPDLNIEDYFFAFRFPLLLVITLLLPLCYLFLVPLVGRWPALTGYAAITLSPILIGMSKIVNPDSLLWLFTLLSFLTYFTFLEKKSRHFLIASGIFLGLALLTKYVANFLLVYFFGFLFLHALWKGELSPHTVRSMLYTFLIWIGIALSVLYLTVPAFWVKPSWLLTSTIFSQAFEKVSWLFLGLILIAMLDQLLWKNWLTLQFISLLQVLRKNLHLFIISFFTLCFFGVILNGLLGMPLINFMEFLASPKSSYQLHTFVPIYLTHFYPLLFGSAPLILVGTLFMIWRTWRTPIEKQTVFERLTIAITLFILLFYLGSTVNHVVLINRYQIMLYPLLALLGGIGLYLASQSLRSSWKKLPLPLNSFSAVVLISVFLTLSPLTTPFPLSYASILLPQDFAIDVKDMGAGSYKSAEYLNSLPEAKQTAIWTDKSGVCKFYIGPCYDGLDFRKANELHIKYLVLSSGRASRTSRFYERDAVKKYPDVIRLDEMYGRQDAVYEIHINGRPSQSIKIFTLVP